MSMIGKTLAHFEITTRLGKSGMGEPYQAKGHKPSPDGGQVCIDPTIESS